MDGSGNWVKKPRPRDWSTRHHNSASLTRDTVEGARKRARVMALEIARQSVGGTGKAIRTWAIARYYVDVRDVSSIILIAEITAASTAPAALSPYFTPAPPFPAHISRHTRRIFSHIMHFRIFVSSVSRCIFNEVETFSFLRSCDSRSYFSKIIVRKGDVENFNYLKIFLNYIRNLFFLTIILYVPPTSS